MPRIPVVVVSGPLGSGKTTLVNHLLRTSGARVGVVINDFGSIDVDALLVAGQVDTTAISGGCLCCLADTSELDTALARLARMDLDVVLVEASGLAEPRELARMILASEAPGIRFGGVVEVLDASCWDGTGLPVAADHLRVATVLVLNKVDRAAAPVDALRAALADVAPTTPVTTATLGAVPPALLFDVADRPEPSGQLSLADLLTADLATEPTEHAHEHGHHESVELDASRPLHPARLVDLLEHRPAGVVRVKGTVEVTGIPGTVVVQAVGDWYTFARPERGADAADGAAGLVVIGAGVDAQDVAGRLADLRTADGEEPSPADVYAVRRFLRP